MRKSFAGAFVALRAAVADLLTPSITTFVAAFAKVEAALERAIDKQHRRLAKMAQAEAAIRAARLAADAELNRAYKLLNNVTELTK